MASEEPPSLKRVSLEDWDSPDLAESGEILALEVFGYTVIQLLCNVSSDTRTEFNTIPCNRCQIMTKLTALMNTHRNTQYKLILLRQLMIVLSSLIILAILRTPQCPETNITVFSGFRSHPRKIQC